MLLADTCWYVADAFSFAQNSTAGQPRAVDFTTPQGRGKVKPCSPADMH